MESDWYVPPTFEPYEVVMPGGGVRRRFIHVDGRVGRPAHAVELLVAGRPVQGAIVVRTAERAPDDRTVSSRVADAAALRDRAGRGLPAGGWSEMEDQVADVTRWDRVRRVVDGVELALERFRLDDRLWCGSVILPTASLTVFAAGGPPEPLELAPVTDWGPYGLDLGAPIAVTDRPPSVDEPPLGDMPTEMRNRRPE